MTSSSIMANFISESATRRTYRVSWRGTFSITLELNFWDERMTIEPRSCLHRPGTTSGRFKSKTYCTT